MKKIFFLLIISIVYIFACNQSTQKAQDQTAEEVVLLPSTGNFGESITPDFAINIKTLSALFGRNDTITTKVSGKVAACCQHSGCWMDLDIGSGQVVNVTFKDGGFTIPKDATGKSAIVDGIAYKEIIPVEKLKLYAKDEGKSQEEIDAITKPEVSYSIVASGVIIE